METRAGEVKHVQRSNPVRYVAIELLKSKTHRKSNSWMVTLNNSDGRTRVGPWLRRTLNFLPYNRK